MTHGDRSIACVGGLAYDDAGRLLLVQRANEPGRGLWSVPGGRVEPGEDDAAALVREMWEETGLRVDSGRAGRPRTARPLRDRGLPLHGRRGAAAGR